MRKLRWLMIALLLVGAAGLGSRLRSDWRAFRAKNDPAALKLRPLPPVSAPEAAPARDYTVVAQQNPFHPERNDALPPPPAPQARPPLGPPPLVYGSMILGQERFALMATDADPKPRKIVEGDVFSGYKLAEVRAQSVVLEADGSKNEVMFYNALARLRREHQKTQSSSAATVATTASGPAAGAAATTVAETPPPPTPPGAAQAGKKMVMTPFGPMWQDVK